jgi:hypothetical protein
MQTIVDPSVNLFLMIFMIRSNACRESFAEGKKDFARYELISTSHFCIECHTRSAAGPAFGTERFNEGMLKLNPLDRADYLTAIRHFDHALEIYLDYFKESASKKINALQSEKAPSAPLLLPFDIKMTPNKAARLADAVQKSPHTPYYLKLAAGAWAADIQDWIKENIAYNANNKKKAIGAAASLTSKPKILDRKITNSAL